MKYQLKQIQERNKRVEADKAWETSIARKTLLAAMTYGVAILFLWSLGIEKPWLHALVPMAGFIISTLTLPFFKNMWLENMYKR